MKTTTKDAWTRFIGGPGPFSGSDFDRKLFNIAVYESIMNEDNGVVDEDDLAPIIREKHEKWDEEAIIKFCDKIKIRFDAIVSFLDFIKAKKNVDIYRIME